MILSGGATMKHVAIAQMTAISPELRKRFKVAVRQIERRLGPSGSRRLSDANASRDCRRWLDGDDDPLPWKGDRLTPDEYFFITTLYGNMTLDEQRAMIRKFFKPLFVQRARRDMRSFRARLGGYSGLRSDWMRTRLCRMGAVLRGRGISMQQYVDELQALDRQATPEDPTPALDKIIADHRALGFKTLSVFVRDCVLGRCFPIDLRVRKQLRDHGLPEDEGLLVRLSYAIHKNPRKLARMFYEADWW
jgi:hypothetical protein